MSRDPAGLSEVLGHAFRDEGLLEGALTHRSADRRHNERLEFLGDSVLNLVIAEALYRRRPDCEEGDLTRYRALLVKGETLAELGRELDLGSYLNLGSGEQKSGGERRSSILADAVEALVGAVFLDGGWEAARGMLLRLYGTRLETLPAAETLKDPKTRLQEILQGRGLERPAYAVTEARGEPHRQWFTASCSVQGLGLSRDGEGRSRRKAEQAAAAAVLAALADGPEHAGDPDGPEDDR